MTLGAGSTEPRWSDQPNYVAQYSALQRLSPSAETTFEYLEGRPMLPKADTKEWEAAKNYWRSLQTLHRRNASQQAG